METRNKKGGRHKKVDIARLEAELDEKEMQSNGSTDINDDSPSANFNKLDESDFNPDMDMSKLGGGGLDQFTTSPIKFREYAQAKAKVINGEIPESVPVPVENIKVLDMSTDDGEEAQYGGENGGRQLADPDSEMLGGKPYDQVKSEEGNRGGGGGSRPSPESFDGGGSRGRSEKTPPLNPEFNDMSTKEKKESSAFVADSILDGYKLLHVVGNHYLGSNMPRLQKRAMKGEFDMSVLDEKIPYDSNGNLKSVGDVVLETDEAVAQSLVVSPEFEEEVRPLLIQVLGKKGIGMSPETRLMLKFGEDAALKVVTLAENKSMLNQILDIAKDQRKSKFAAVQQQIIVQQVQAPPVQVQQVQQAPVQQPTVVAPQPTVSSNKKEDPKKAKGRPKKKQIEELEAGE